ncbi:MAG: TolB family protein [Planctomycetota bacterium]|jgi:Tol biopolymer transport system component
MTITTCDKSGTLTKQMTSIAFIGICWFGLSVVFGEEAVQDKRVAQLAKEVGKKGWIAYSSRAENGTWDLFISRPDGSQRRNITNTPDFEETAPLFSPDNKKMLFRRIAKGSIIKHDKWGFEGRMVIANADGTNPVLIGKEREYPWATWSPDGKQVACLTLKGIQIIDLTNSKVVRKLSRQGIYQSLRWSPDGKYFCGVANTLGMWTIVRVNVATGKLNPVHKFQNCTPDWFPDSRRIIFSSRPGNQGGYGWTQLWMAEGEGKNHRLVYGEDGFHIYGGGLSPDGKYVLLTKCPKDGGGSERSGAPIFIMRFADAPSIGGESKKLRKLHPNTKDGPLLSIGKGFEPCWTYAEIGTKK